MLEIIKVLLEELDSDKKHMPPTILYNEGWLLRVILWYLSQYQIKDLPFSFCNGADWYSEGLLRSPFLPVYRGDELAESYTHADGIIGNIAVGGVGQSDIRLIDPYEQFIVLEAKLYSRLSGGTTRAPGYNQAARNIACMAEVVKRSGCSI